MEPEIVVIGSINHDLTVLTARHPGPGETVLGTGHYSGGGGKGANQAIAAARAGARVAMVGRVGDDDHGRTLTGAIAAEGIDIASISIDPDEPTGIAVITVDDDAENTIVVSPGANLRLHPDHLDRELIASAPVVLAQLEVPVDTVRAVASMCKGQLLLNPAPAHPLPEDLLGRVDVLIPNRSELASLSELDEVVSPTDITEAVRSLSHSGPTVVTMGPEGAMLVDGDRVERFPAPQVSAVDPTGAGDAFCGVLAHALSQGMTLESAVERAVVAGSIATTRAGAQTAMPTRDDIDAQL